MTNLIYSTMFTSGFCQQSVSLAALRSFDRSVTEQELDLLQFSSSSMAQAGTRAAEVMRG